MLGRSALLAATNSGGPPGFVSLLLHMDGTNGSTTFVDSSFTPKTIANNGAQISTAQSRFGNSSGRFTVASNSSLVTSPSSDLILGTSDFTVEAWAYHESVTSVPLICQLGSGQDSYSPCFCQYVNGTLFVFLSSNGAAWDIASFASLGSLNLNVWNHYALTRQGSTFRAFNNGVQTSTWQSSLSIYQSAGQVIIGDGQSPLLDNRNFQGYIDEFRVTKGVAHYTANFTPPTEPFPDF